MKLKEPPSKKGNRVPGNDKVRAEIQTFLEALASYPERFAADPGITFEEYCSHLFLSVNAIASSSESSVNACDR